MHILIVYINEKLRTFLDFQAQALVGKLTYKDSFVMLMIWMGD